MLVGSAPSELKLGTTTVTGVRRGAGLIYDSDVAAFQKASGATQVGPILALVDYLKAESLWDYARFYPMKSAQNAGSGSTVYGLGGLTSNNMTLVNSPTWGSDGVTFASASSQYGTISDFLGGGTVSAWARLDHTSGSAVLTQYDFGASKRSIALDLSGANVVAARSPTGLSPEVYAGASSVSGENTISAEWIDGAGRSIWVNKNAETISLIGGTPQTSRLNTDATIGLMANFNNGVAANLSSGTVVLAGVIETALTTTQRETITDLINAL